jgi:hypothetical protein
METRERRALTFWRRPREGLVMTRKEIDRARHTYFLRTAEGGAFQDTEKGHVAMGTHILKTAEAETSHKLEMVEGGTCQNTERDRPNEAHSPSGDGRSRGLVRTQKDVD